MSVINSKITAPVSLLDVKNTLGESSLDLGHLCTSPYINKWAKYKPVRSSLLHLDRTLELTSTTPGGAQVTHASYLGDCTSENLKTYYDEYTGQQIVSVSNNTIGIDHINIAGMEVPVLSEGVDSENFLRRAATMIDFNILDWEATHPRGKIQNGNSYKYEYYRLTDFEGYNHNAECVFGVTSPDNEIYGNSLIANVYITSSNDAIEVSDIASFMSAYGYRFGAIVYQENNIDYTLLPNSSILWTGEEGDSLGILIYYEELEGLGINPYIEFDLYMCLIKKIKNSGRNIIFFPKGNTYHITTKFANGGMDPDLYGGIGHIKFNPQYCSTSDITDDVELLNYSYVRAGDYGTRGQFYIWGTLTNDSADTEINMENYYLKLDINAHIYNTETLLSLNVTNTIYEIQSDIDVIDVAQSHITRRIESSQDLESLTLLTTPINIYFEVDAIGNSSIDFGNNDIIYGTAVLKAYKEKRSDEYHDIPDIPLGAFSFAYSYHYDSSENYPNFVNMGDYTNLVGYDSNTSDIVTTFKREFNIPNDTD